MYDALHCKATSNQSKTKRDGSPMVMSRYAVSSEACPTSARLANTESEARLRVLPCPCDVRTCREGVIDFLGRAVTIAVLASQVPYTSRMVDRDSNSMHPPSYERLEQRCSTASANNVLGFVVPQLFAQVTSVDTSAVLYRFTIALYYRSKVRCGLAYHFQHTDFSQHG